MSGSVTTIDLLLKSPEQENQVSVGSLEHDPSPGSTTLSSKEFPIVQTHTGYLPLPPIPKSHRELQNQSIFYASRNGNFPRQDNRKIQPQLQFADFTYNLYSLQGF